MSLASENRLLGTGCSILDARCWILDEIMVHGSGFEVQGKRPNRKDVGVALWPYGVISS